MPEGVPGLLRDRTRRTGKAPLGEATVRRFLRPAPPVQAKRRSLRQRRSPQAAHPVSSIGQVAQRTPRRSQNSIV
jgi:hypothetical protein